MEPAGFVKGSEASLGSRPGLRSCSSQPSCDPSSMGQNALGTYVNGTVHDTPSSTTGSHDLGSSRGSTASDRSAPHLPVVNVRSSCSAVGIDQSPASSLSPLSSDKGRGRPSELSGRNGSSAFCRHCGATLDGNGEKKKYKELWYLQLQMIDEQRATLLEREAELQELREVKSRLEARVARMEQRLTLLGGGGDRAELDSGDSVGSPVAPADSTPGKLSAKLREVKRPSGVAFGLEPASRSPSPCWRGGKRGRSPRTPRPAHLFTNILYDAPSRKHVVSALCRDTEPAGDRGNVVSVPSWRTVEEEAKPVTGSLRRSASGKDVENLSDETFLQRHLKHEQEEKRIKRWDLQRVRKQREHEKLLKRYEQKEVKWHKQNSEDSREVITSFMPQLEGLQAIELSDELPVMAFGSLVPNLERSEFSLPWFDPAKRAADGEARKTRSKSRGCTSEGQ